MKLATMSGLGAKIKSNKAKGVVGKLRFEQTGPWEITSIQPGGSYELRHNHKHNTNDKEGYKIVTVSPKINFYATIGCMQYILW